jgi:hypothetical protein
MTISLSTPALLFSAISLLLLAFTNRFLAIARLIRELHGKYLHEGDQGVVVGQIKNLRLRLNLIRNMQFFGVFSFFLCVLSMIFIYGSNESWGSYFFGASMVFLLVSLGISLREVQLSTKALELELSDMELGSNPKF